MKDIIDWLLSQWRGLRFGVQSLIRWLPVVWYDRDWDSWYLLNVFAHKINLMADGIERRDLYEGVERDVRNMRRAVKLLRSLRDQEYMVGFLDDLKHDGREPTMDSNGSTIHPPLSEGDAEIVKNALNRSYKRFQAMSAECFDLIRREFIKWWD